MIRDATVADARAIAEMHTRSWYRAYQDVISHDVLTRQTVDDREENWRRHLEEGTGAVLVYELDGRIAGVAAVGASRDADAPDGVGELAALYVEPAAQGAGVGTALLEAAVQRLRAAGHAEAWLWTFRENAAARAFYEHQGWEPVPGSEAAAPAEWREPALRYRRGL